MERRRPFARLTGRVFFASLSHEESEKRERDAIQIEYITALFELAPRPSECEREIGESRQEEIG